MKIAVWPGSQSIFAQNYNRVEWSDWVSMSEWSGSEHDRNVINCTAAPCARSWNAHTQYRRSLYSTGLQYSELLIRLTRSLFTEQTMIVFTRKFKAIAIAAERKRWLFRVISFLTLSMHVIYVLLFQRKMNKNEKYGIEPIVFRHADCTGKIVHLYINAFRIPKK